MPKGFGAPMTHLDRYLTMDECEKIIAEAKLHNYTHYVFLVTLLRTGARVSEIVMGKELFGIRKRNLDLDHNKITLTSLKKRPRIEEKITIDSELAILLRQYCDKIGIDDDSFLFPYTRFWAFGLVRQYGKAAGIEKWKLHPHIFRHSFAIHYAKNLKSPADLEELKRKLRHTTIGMTTQYLQFMGEDKKLTDQVMLGDKEIRISVNEFQANPNIIPINKAGVYIFYDTLDSVLYVGRAENLKARLTQHLISANIATKFLLRITFELYKNPYLVETIGLIFNPELEKEMIKNLNPKYNDISLESWQEEALKNNIPIDKLEKYKEEYEKEMQERMKNFIERTSKEVVEK